MATDSILRSYSDVSVKEDVVLNAIEILTATETYIMNMVGNASAIATVHSYLTDTLDTVGSLAVAESGDYTAKALTTPSRLTNIIQHVAYPFKVSRTQQEISHYHGKDELTRQTEKAMLNWANAAEYDFVRSTLTSGASGTTVKMSGLIEACSKSTNHTSHDSGTTWAASILDGLLKNQYDNSNGDMATDLFMGSFLRKVTDGFTQKTYSVIDGMGATSIINTVSTYQNAFGTLKIHTHRHIQISGTDATGRVFALRPDKIRKAWLKMPYIDTGLSRSGDYDTRAIVGKLTAEIHNQDSAFYADGFSLS